MGLLFRTVGFAGAAVFASVAIVAAETPRIHFGTITTIVRGQGHDFYELSPDGSSPVQNELKIVFTKPDGTETAVVATVGKEVAVDLPSAGKVRVDCESDYWWSPGAVVSRKNPNSELHLYPSGIIKGSIVTASDLPISGLSLRFVPVDGDEFQLLRDDGASEWGRDSQSRHGEARCEVLEKSNFECILPVGLVRMRIRTDRLAAKFFWNVRVDAQTPVDLGSVRLKPGATLTGRIESSSGEEIPKECAISVLSGGDSASAIPEDDINRVRLSEDGWFQVRGIDTGVFTLVAECRQYARSEIHEIHINAGRDIIINDPVVISPAFNLDGNIVPPLNPYGLRWRVVLRDQDKRRRATFTSTADDIGSWTIEDIQSGRYAIEVQADSDPPSMRFHGGEIYVRSDPPPVLVDIELVPVHGVVRYGEEPVDATITFGSSVDPSRTVPYIAATTDSKGEFETWLSYPGWEGGAEFPWPVIVESTDPKLHIERFVGVRKPSGGGDVARIEIRIPKTVLAGRVIDAEGQPVKHARVLAKVIGSSEHENKSWYGPVGTSIGDDSTFVTDGDGVFELVGLPRDRIRVFAKDEKGRESAAVTVNLRHRATRDDVELRIEDLRDVTVLVDSGGLPVGGATLDVRVKGSAIGKTTRTNEAGVATTAIRADGEHPVVFLSILPPGRCLSTATFQVPENGQPYVVSIPTTECGMIEILPPPGGFDVSLFVLKGEGGYFTSFRLDSWAKANLPADQAQTLIEAVIAGDSFFVPRVAPGFYSVCLFSSRESYNSFLSGGVVAPGECSTSQHLAPFGTVEFDLTRD